MATPTDQTPPRETPVEESVSAPQTSPPVEAQPERKKLREKIADLFRKKPAEKEEESRPAPVEDGERRATRREEGSTLVQLLAVRFTVPNDWMMGINGATATLTNRSSETVGKAVVEVSYYNDDNEVLAKRTLTFRNVKSKGTQTLPVADHQTATRLTYSVVSAEGAGSPLARR